jgi:hypothetical protein
MVDAVLRVVLDDEDRHVLPERRMRQSLDNLPESEIVVGDARAWRTPARGRAHCVIIRQNDHDEVRHVARCFPIGEVRQNVARFDHVGHFLRPAGILAHELPIERRNVGVGLEASLQ